LRTAIDRCFGSAVEQADKSKRFKKLTMRTENVDVYATDHLIFSVQPRSLYVKKYPEERRFPRICGSASSPVISDSSLLHATN
jgi:hypothetical protein